MRWMNRLATAVIVLAVVAGPPVLFTVWLLHDPRQPPTRAQLQAWAEQPVTTGTIITACAAVAGLAWLLLLIHLTRRALAGLRRRLYRMRHLAVPTPAQMTASSMAGIAALTLPTAPADHPPPPPGTTGTPQLTGRAGSDHDADRRSQDQPAGITLPGGGWIPYSTAVAIAALAAAAWLQRRRSYRPDPGRPGDHHHDPDLQPLPDTVQTITTAVTDVATGPDREPPPLRTPQLPDGVLLLTGPGAAAAARGILVTAALGGTSDVCVRSSDLETLLPGGDHPNVSIAKPRNDTGERPVARTTIVLGDTAATHHWHIATDGTATGAGLTAPHRLCTLDPQTTVDLLALAHPSPSPAPQADPPPTPEIGRPPEAFTGEPITAPASAAHLTLLGDCHLTIDAQPVHLRRTASLQIVAYLAIHPRGATRTELTHAIWPHLPAATIRQRLHTTLTDLRQQLRPLLGQDPVIRHDDHYRLNTHAISTDLQQWRNAVHALTHAVGTTAQQHACHGIADMYRGDLAAEHTWPWLTPAREQTRRTVIDAYTTLADHADTDEATYWLQRALVVDPYNEALHHQAADLLKSTGDTAGAAGLIKRLHQRLADGARELS